MKTSNTFRRQLGKLRSFLTAAVVSATLPVSQMAFAELGEPEKALADYRQFVVEYSDHPKIMEAKANIARMEQMGLAVTSEPGENSDEPVE